MNHRDEAEALVSEVHDPAMAALIHAVLAVVDAFESPPPDEPEPEVPFEQTAAGWTWEVKPGG